MQIQNKQPMPAAFSTEESADFRVLDLGDVEQVSGGMKSVGEIIDGVIHAGRTLWVFISGLKRGC